MRTRQEETARKILQHLINNGYKAYFAGGYVRDMLLGLKEKGDIDIATDALPQAISSLFSHVVGVGEHFGVMLVIENGLPFEVATFRSDVGISDGRHPDHIVPADIKTDALRRDFTINGLFYDPISKQIFDYIDGQTDLKKGIIRAIGDPVLRFKEDYLRLLRALRFAACFKFEIEPETWKALTQNADVISTVSQERIFQEMNKMFAGPNPRLALKLLHKSGLLKVILPEVSSLCGIPQPAQFHPEGDVLTHTEIALSLLNKPTPVTAWSTLLHDIGKPATISRKDRIRFNNHHRVGAKMARNVLQRLKCSKSLIDAVYACVDNHMNFMNVKKMRLSKLKNFLARPTINDEIELHRVDCLASHGDLENFNFIREMQNKFAYETLRPKPFLTGKDLISLGLKPGPLFGTILKNAYNLQLDEKFRSREDALEWTRHNLDDFKK